MIVDGNQIGTRACYLVCQAFANCRLEFHLSLLFFFSCLLGCTSNGDQRAIKRSETYRMQVVLSAAYSSHLASGGKRVGDIDALINILELQTQDTIWYEGNHLTDWDRELAKRLIEYRVDGFGEKFALETNDSGEVNIVSSGSDCRFGTRDDIVLLIDWLPSQVGRVSNESKNNN